jgi:hypothetical protein
VARRVEGGRNAQHAPVFVVAVAGIGMPEAHRLR